MVEASSIKEQREETDLDRLLNIVNQSIDIHISELVPDPNFQVQFGSFAKALINMEATLNQEIAQNYESIFKASL